jgi:anti-sigma regulatory factor (Ser/Thr protein kinase)
VSVGAPTISLELASRPENLTLVRGMLGGVGEVLSIDPELLDDLKTAVSEACNNVVLHAYDGREGPLAVQMYVEPDEIKVLVRDEGLGLIYARPVDDPAQGIGVPVIQALATQTDFRTGADGGTEVVMSFSGERDGKPLFTRAGISVPDDGWTKPLRGDAVVSVSPVALLASVLGRLMRALAASARFSLDRFSDVYLVTDALAALARHASLSERVGFVLTAQSRRIELTIGPFRRGLDDLLGSDDPVFGARSPLALLTDGIELTVEDGSERLLVAMIDKR